MAITNCKYPYAPGCRTSSGFTLIEVLIALLVLSVGLLGLAALHLSSLQYAHSAYYRSIVSAAALKFEERMWLEAAEIAPGSGCLNQANFSSMESDFNAEWQGVGSRENAPWGWGGASWAQIPDLKINVGELTTTSTHVQVPISFQWSESRFSAGGETERFDFVARVKCVN